MGASSVARSSAPWLSVFALAALLASSPASSLVCRCTDQKLCHGGPWCQTDRETAACVAMFAYNGTHHVRKALFCSEAGEECPRDSSEKQIGSHVTTGLTLCCKSNMCNTDLKPPDPVVHTSPPQAITTPAGRARPGFANLPPPSLGKLRCDCSSAHTENCIKDRGPRQLEHCTVERGWCVTVARPTVIWGFKDLPPSYSRFCTTDADLCRAGIGRDRSVQCCSNTKFCNQDLKPPLHEGTLFVGATRAPTRPTEAPLVNFTTARTENSSSTEVTITEDTNATATPASTLDSATTSIPTQQTSNGKTWCHCNSLQQHCNDSFPFCETDGKCQSIPSFLQFEPDHLHCVSKSNDHLCTAAEPCCTGHCCNKAGPCTPVPTPVTEAPVVIPKEYNCHCFNCHKTHRCHTKYGCLVHYDNQTGKATQSCLKEEGKVMTQCGPTFAVSQHLLQHTFSVGNSHVHCCRGNLCNSKHPEFPHVVPEKRFPCRCSAGHCEEAYTFCVTSLNGGVCYRGVEGQFCIDAAETARKARLCADGVSCCNTSFCNELDIGTTQSTRPISSVSPGQNSTTSDDAAKGRGRITSKFEVLYIGISVAGILFVCCMLLVVLIICRYQGRRQHNLEKQRRQGGNRPRHQPLRNRGELPKSTFDTLPVMLQLSAWQREEQRRSSMPLAQDDVPPLQENVQLRSFSLASGTLSDSGESSGKESSGKESPATLNTTDEKSATNSPAEKSNLTLATKNAVTNYTFQKEELNTDPSSVFDSEL